MNEKLQTPKTKKERNTERLRKIIVCSILSAASAVLMVFLGFKIPIVPEYLTFDFSDFPPLLAAFSLGPLWGIAVCLVKNLLNLLINGSISGGIGELSNFLLGSSFVFIAGIIYKIKRNKAAAVAGSLTGAFFMTAMSFPVNLFIIYPIYISKMSEAAILSSFTAILPSVDSLKMGILIFNMPFTLAKGLTSVLITVLIYKKLSPLIKGKNIID